MYVKNDPQVKLVYRNLTSFNDPIDFEISFPKSKLLKEQFYCLVISNTATNGAFSNKKKRLPTHKSMKTTATTFVLPAGRHPIYKGRREMVGVLSPLP